MKTIHYTARIQTTILTAILTLSLITTSALITPHKAFAATDTYPAPWAPPTTKDSMFDNWHELNRECTSYAAWMLHSVNGFEMPFNNDANYWGTEAAGAPYNYTVNMTPAVGSIYWSTSSDHVAWVESVSANGSTITTEDYNSGYPTNPGWYAEHPGVATSSASGYIHFKDLPYADGTYLRASDTGAVYVMAGGAAIAVYSWSNVGGVQPYISTTQAAINAMATYPRDGTIIRAYTTGGVYVVAGGAPTNVYSWSNIGGTQPYTNIDVNALTLQLRQYPANGTYIRGYTTGAVYVVAGGAPMFVSNWANVGGTQPYTNIDANAITLQLPQYPADGTVIRAYTTGAVYLVAGGAPMAVSSWSTIGGAQPYTNIDVWDIANQLRQYPSDGTYAQPYGTGAVYTVAGGAALTVTSWSAVGGVHPLAIIPSDSLSQFLSYPQNGTYVRGYASGEEFEAISGAVTRIITTPLPPATIVDDWAIINQLGGTE